MEYLDIYDEFGKYMGVESREEVHKQGLWHKTVHCWLYDKEGNIYFQIRKDRGTLYTTASGHVMSKETVEEAFVREIKEEIGIELRPENARFGMVVPFKMDRKKTDGTLFKDRAFANIYFSEFDGDNSSFHFDLEEIKGLAKVSVTEALELFKGNIENINGSVVFCENDLNREEKKTFFSTDFLLNEGETLLEKYGDILNKVIELVGGKNEKDQK